MERHRQLAVCTGDKCAETESRKPGGLVHFYVENRTRRISKTMAMSAKKPGAGVNTVRWEIKNDRPINVTVDVAAWDPRNPFVRSQPARKVKGNGGRGQLPRRIGPSVDRDTYTYKLKWNNHVVDVDDPWLIVYQGLFSGGTYRGTASLEPHTRLASRYRRSKDEQDKERQDVCGHPA